MINQSAQHTVFPFQSAQHTTLREYETLDLDDHTVKGLVSVILVVMLFFVGPATFQTKDARLQPEEQPGPCYLRASK